jgi:predicted metalloenzyme YecM
MRGMDTAAGRILSTSLINPTIVSLYEIAQGVGVSHVELVRED